MSESEREALRTALQPKRGYPVTAFVAGHEAPGSTRWVSDPNGAYIGFEDAIDAVSALSPEPEPVAGLDVVSDCDHPRIGPMEPDFPGQWACYRCGQRFMPQNAALTEPTP